MTLLQSRASCAALELKLPMMQSNRQRKTPLALSSARVSSSSSKSLKSAKRSMRRELSAKGRQKKRSRVKGRRRLIVSQLLKKSSRKAKCRR